MTGVGAALLGLAVLGVAALASITAHAAPPASPAVALIAPRCAATVEAAARGIVGAAAAGDEGGGYRAQDLIVDPVLRKAYIRVADCHDPRRPLTLVPLQARLASSSPVDGPSAGSAGHGVIPPPPVANASAHDEPAPTMLIARGDVVEVVLQSSSVHMNLRGHAAQAAALGQALDVVLDGEPGEAVRHMHATAVAAHQVEVLR